MNLLAKIPELKVIGRTSSFAFKGKNEDLRVIGQTLGVATLLEGSVRKSGNEVRITAQLIDTSDGTHIWSETYDRTMTDIFEVQESVAAAIIDALQIHVGANPTRGRPTNNAEAYVLFLRARASFNAGELRDAEAFSLQGIELDPEFAEAYQQLAYFYWSLAGQFIRAAEGQQLTYNAAAKALAIDPDLVFAQLLHHSANIESSILGDIEAFERAALEQPSDLRILRALSGYLRYAGYFQEALGFAERLVELEPLLPRAHSRMFESLYAVGRTGEAVAALEVSVELGNELNKWWIAEVNLVEKQYDLAIANFEAAQEQYGLPSDWFRGLVTGARDPATGQAYLDRHIPQVIASLPEEDRAVTQQSLTRWYLYLGFLDRYFELILDLDLTDAVWTDAYNLFSEGILYRGLGFTAHPMFLEVAESLGIIDVWEQRGPPDFCDKVGREWVCE